MWLHIPSTQSQSVQESAGSTSESDERCQAFARSCTSSGKSRQPRYWRRECATAYWSRLLSGATLPPSLAQKSAITFARQLAGEASGCFTEESLVSRILLQESDEAQTTNATYGRSRCEQSNTTDRDCSFWRTSPASSVSCPRGLSLICDGLGTSCLDRSCLRPQMSERVRGENGYSCWQCPQAADDGHKVTAASRQGLIPQVSKWSCPSIRASEVEKMPHNHGDAMDSLTAVTEKWATPASRDHKDGACENADVPENRLLGRESVAFHPDPASDLTELLKKFSTLSSKESRTQAIAFLQNLLNGRRGSVSSKPGPTSRRRLNVKFTTWLMGLPENWASVEPISFADSETASCQTVRRKR